MDAIRRTHDRIVAVHFKDWSPEFGRSSHRYARWFVELGDGSVDLDGVIDELNRVGYDGWLVVEQDYTLTDPIANTIHSARWLARRGLLPEPPREIKSRAGLRGSAGQRTCPPKKEALFLRSVARASLP